MYQIRKCVTYTLVDATEVSNLNPEHFRNLSVPYEGNSEEEFLEYLDDNQYEFYELSGELEEQGFKETAEELDKIGDGSDYTTISNSAIKGEESWLELGEKDEKATKWGEFSPTHDTQTTQDW
jgi:hypothetical protein